MTEKIQMNVVEAKKQQRDIFRKVTAASEEIRKKSRYIDNLLQQGEQLTELIRKNDEEQKAWMISVPVALLQDPEAKVLHKGSFNMPWKKAVLEIIMEDNMPMDSQLIYHKIKQRYPNFDGDRRFAIKNISSALATLYDTDQLTREKINGKKNFVYGLSRFLDDMGHLSKDFLESYKRESNKW